MLLRTLLLICLAVPACGTADNSPPPIKLEYPAGGPPLNEHFSFYVLNVDKQDATLVDVDADMPAHKHGILTDPSIELQEDGRYRVDGMLLHMPGDWEIYLDLQYANGAVHRQTIPLILEH
ncbi:MAG: hypothetical protein CMJ94_01735 [Planctomycetes bacterium]|nr:hypothetical protein [Planctomycetota bacterium]